VGAAAEAAPHRDRTTYLQQHDLQEKERAMNRKTIAIILAVLAIGLVGYWVAAGGLLFTQEKVAVEVKDELFGTTSTEWKEDYRPGLLPIIGPAAGALLLLSAGLLWSSRRRVEA
jgi:hypothetical protein